MGMEMLEGMSCETLYAYYKQMVTALKNAMELPRKLLRKIVQAISYPFERASKLLNDYVLLLKSAVFDFVNSPISAVKKALMTMLDCPFIQKLYGMLIESMLDLLDKGLGIPATMFNNLKSSILDRVTGVLNQYKKLALNPVGSMKSRYDKLLNSTGAKTIMQTIADIQSCIGLMCGTYKAVKPYMPDDVPNPLTEYGVIVDAAGKVVTDLKATVVDKVNGVKNTAKKIATDVVKDAEEKSQLVADKYNELKKMYDEVSAAPVVPPVVPA